MCAAGLVQLELAKQLRRAAVESGKERDQRLISWRCGIQLDVEHNLVATGLVVAEGRRADRLAEVFSRQRVRCRLWCRLCYHRRGGDQRWRLVGWHDFDLAGHVGAAGRAVQFAVVGKVADLVEGVLELLST